MAENRVVSPTNCDTLGCFEICCVLAIIIIIMSTCNNSRLLRNFLECVIDSGDAVTVQLVDNTTVDLANLTEANADFLVGNLTNADAPYDSALIWLFNTMSIAVDNPDCAYA